MKKSHGSRNVCRLCRGGQGCANMRCPLCHPIEPFERVVHKNEFFGSASHRRILRNSWNHNDRLLICLLYMDEAHGWIGLHRGNHQNLRYRQCSWLQWLSERDAGCNVHVKSRRLDGRKEYRLKNLQVNTPNVRPVNSGEEWQHLEFREAWNSLVTVAAEGADGCLSMIVTI